jgi:hypothetical protein
MKNTTLDPKLQYIVKSLSKTNRKDYENFIINAIWHKLSNPNIEIISQQFVKNNDITDNRSHYFIDLYFPSLNIGIECDEPYHLGANQSLRDSQRSISLQDILYSIKSNNYEQIRIKIFGTIEEVNDQINTAVDKIKKRIQDLNPAAWSIQSSAEYFENKKYISINDRIGFKSINEVCNTLYNAGRKEDNKGATRSYFTLPKFTNTELENHKLWFPKLAIKINDEFGNEILRPATRTGWTNQISQDGTIITEWNENDIPYKNDKKRRVVFIKYKDSLGFNEYKFAGVFEFFEKIDDRNIYKRCSEICSILK